MAKVLFDHNMPPRIARALHALIEVEGHEAWALRDKFAIDISDIDLFKALSKERGWIVISKDLMNAKRRPEREVIMSSGVIAIYLPKSVQKQRVTEQAASILWQWERILRQRNDNINGMYQLPVGKGRGFKAIY